MFVAHILGSIKIPIDQSTCTTIITGISTSAISTPTIATTTATAFIISTPSSYFKISFNSILVVEVVTIQH